ncbi:MAG TPA: tetratricopeptide repeat protein, partial [Abditibacteriaceae bacterium]
RWKRLEDTEGRAAPRIEVRLKTRWRWLDKKGAAHTERQIWDIWFENSEGTPRITTLRRGDADLRAELRDKEAAAWYNAWLLDGERDRFTETYWAELNNWVVDVTYTDRDAGRAAVQSYLTAAYLANAPVQQARALMARAFIQSYYFYEDPNAAKAALDDSDEAVRGFFHSGHLTGTAKALVMVGSRAGENKNYETARELHEVALEFARKTDDIAGQIEALECLGDDLTNLQRYGEAKAHYEEELKLARAEKDMPNILDARQNLAKLNFNSGKIGPAIAEMLDCREDAAKADLAFQGSNAATMLGQAYHATGQIDEAIASYRDALRISEKTENKNINQLRLYSQLAETYSERFLARGGREGYVIQETDLDEAQEMMKRHQALLEQTTPSRAKQIEAVTQGLVQLNLNLRWSRIEPAKAKDLHGACEDTISSLEAEPLLQTIPELKGKVLLWKAELRRQQKRLPEALEAQTAAAKVLEKEETGGKMVLLQRRGDILRDMNRLDEAITAYRDALRILEFYRTSATEEVLQSKITGSNIEIYNELTNALHRSKASSDALLDAVESSRARSLVEMMQNGRVDVTKGMPPAVRQEEEQLQREVTQLQLKLDTLAGGKNEREVALLAELTRGGVTAPESETLRVQLNNARLRYDAFQRELYLKHPALQTQRAQWQAPTLALIGEKLFKAHPGRRILSYVVSEDTTLLLVLSPGKDGKASLETHTIDMRRSELQKLVRTARRSLVRPSGVEEDYSELRDLLIGPATDALDGATE